MADLTKSGVPSLSTLTPDHSCQVGSGLLAGEKIAAGDVCYIKSDGKVYKSDGSAADAAAAADGIAARAAVAGGPVTLYRNVEFHYGSGLTPGARFYVSAETAGALADAPSTGGNVPCAFAVDATRIRFVGSYPLVLPAA